MDESEGKTVDDAIAEDDDDVEKTNEEDMCVVLPNLDVVDTDNEDEEEEVGRENASAQYLCGDSRSSRSWTKRRWSKLLAIGMVWSKLQRHDIIIIA